MFRTKQGTYSWNGEAEAERKVKTLTHGRCQANAVHLGRNIACLSPILIGQESSTSVASSYRKTMTSHTVLTQSRAPSHCKQCQKRQSPEVGVTNRNNILMYHNKNKSWCRNATQISGNTETCSFCSPVRQYIKSINKMTGIVTPDQCKW